MSGEWMCPCGESTDIGLNECHMCGRQRAAPVRFLPGAEIKPRPSYETKLRDEAAMRAHAALLQNVDEYNPRLRCAANHAWDAAAEFMAERAKRMEGDTNG